MGGNSLEFISDPSPVRLELSNNSCQEKILPTHSFQTEFRCDMSYGRSAIIKVENKKKSPRHPPGLFRVWGLVSSGARRRSQPVHIQRHAAFRPAKSFRLTILATTRLL